MSAILACSLYRDDPLVRAIAESNSRGNPYAILDMSLPPDSPEQPPVPRSPGAAIPTLQKILDSRGDALLGFMQIPASWAAAYRKGPQDLFDPCTNISIGTAKLSELDYECLHLAAPRARKPRLPTNGPALSALRRCIIRKYARAIQMPEFELVIFLELSHQHPRGPASVPESALPERDRAANPREASLFFPVVPREAILNPFEQSIRPSVALPPILPGHQAAQDLASPEVATEPPRAGGSRTQQQPARDTRAP